MRPAHSQDHFRMNVIDIGAARLARSKPPIDPEIAWIRETARRAAADVIASRE